jgi:hypothetical protein
MSIPAALLRLMGTRVLNEQVAHHPGRQRTEVRLAPRIDTLSVDESEVGVVK